MIFLINKQKHLNCETAKKEESTLRIRKAVISDSGALARFYHDVWDTAFPDMTLPDEFINSITLEERQRKWNESLLKETENTLVIVNEDREIIGVSSFETCAPDDKICYESEIVSIYIHPDYQNQGLGKMLFEAMLNLIQQAGFNNTMLWSVETNVRAHKFYEKIGGVFLGREDMILVVLRPLRLLMVGQSWSGLVTLVHK